MLEAVGKGATSAAGARRIRPARTKIWCAAMLAGACAAPLRAAETGYGVGLALTHDSNIARVETDPQSEWTRSLIFGVFFRENTASLTARVLAQVEKRNFVNNTFPDDTGGFLDGAAVWTILPRRLIWSVDDVYREVQFALTSPNTPTNYTKSNTFNTGPDLTIPFSSTNSAVVGARYGRFDIKNSINDNQRYSGFLRGVHELSPQARLSLNYEATHTYLEPGAQTYTQVLLEDAFLRFDSRSPVNTTLIDLGRTRVNQYGGPPLEPARLARASFSQALSSQSTLRLVLVDQISDTFTDQMAGATSSTAPRDTGVVLVTASSLATGDLYRSERGDLAYTNNDGRFIYTLQGYGRNVDFQTINQDYSERGGNFAWSWIRSTALRFNALMNYTRRTFPSLDRQDIDRTFGVNGVYGLSSNITVTLSVGRFVRDSTAPLNSYVDNQVSLILGYSSGFVDVRSRR